jgi:ribosomal protein L37E
MKIFSKLRKKEEETEDHIKCDVCGNTLHSYQTNENKKLCKECFSKINENED